MNALRPSLILAALLAGCAVAVVPPAPDGADVGGTVAAPGRKAPAKAAASAAAAGAGGKASAAPTSGAPVALTGSAPPIAALRPSAAPRLATRFPTKILPQLPATLVAAGGGNLVGNDGGTLISDDGSTLIGNDGGTLISDDGSTLIGNDGGTYRLAQVPQASCGPLFDPDGTRALFKGAFEDFLNNCRGIEQVLADAAALELVPGVPERVEDIDEEGKPITLTYVLEDGPAGGALKVAEGPEATPENFLLVLRYASAEAGEAFYHVAGERIGLKIGARIRFDLAKGTVSADSGTNFSFMGAPAFRTRRQVELARLPGGGPDAPVLRVASATNQVPGSTGCAEDRTTLAVHYLPDDRAVMQLGRATAAGAPLVYLGLDGAREAAPGPTTGFFMAKDGLLLGAAEVTPALRAALPTAAEMVPMPALLASDDVFREAVYTPTW